MKQSNETQGRHITTHGSGGLTVLIYVGGVEGHDWLGKYGTNLVSRGERNSSGSYSHAQ
jgi:hypothetical protein